MEMSVALGVLGVIATVTLGVWALIIARSRYPGQITFVQEQTIELFDEIVKNLEDLSISYKGNEIGENLVLLNGAFVNSGKIDVSPEMTEKPLAMSLPEGFRWLTAKVISSSPDVKAEIEVQTENIITLKSGLFRCGEYIRFQALAEVLMPPVDDSKSYRRSLSKLLEGSLQLSHRILNTRAIEKRSLDRPGHIVRTRSEVRLLGAAMLVLVLAIGGFLWVKGIPRVPVYAYNSKDGKQIQVTIKVTADGIEVRGFDDDYQEVVSLEEFVRRGSGVPALKRDKGFAGFIIFMVALVLMPLLMSTFEYMKTRRSLKLRKLLEL